MPKLTTAISTFGSEIKKRLDADAKANREEQLRAPFEALIKQLVVEFGIAKESDVLLVPESKITELKTRPDYAVMLHGVLIGHVELKAPGKGANPKRFKGHDKEQWEKLRQLPNLLYVDGNSFSLWHSGEAHQTGVVTLKGSVEDDGAKVNAPETLRTLVCAFLDWEPSKPTSAPQLAVTAARLCRLLRDQVHEEVERGNSDLLSLQEAWKTLLFPEDGDWNFENAYAQSIVFGLLMGRAREVDLTQSLQKAAVDLAEENTLIGEAVRQLTNSKQVREALRTSLQTIQRVLSVVEWSALTGDDPDAWLLFYEDFLQVYDPRLRKQTGSYYTPPVVVDAMVRLTDEVLRSSDVFDKPLGLADPAVNVCDPATGTGTFMLGIIKRVAAIVEADLGKPAVPGEIAALAQRLYGFELQFGPFAVSELRLTAEIKALLGQPTGGGGTPPARVYLTDTLADPYQDVENLKGLAGVIAEVRSQADRIKREEPITVVIGNPPYKDEASGLGGWIERGRGQGGQPPLDRWQPPTEWGLGTHARHLRNLYVFFWRWATMKVFGSGWEEVVGTEPTSTNGIVCFIMPSAFLEAQAFQKARSDLRASCGDIWVIDCTPEGHQSEQKTRVFTGVAQPVCIVLAARSTAKAADQQARVHYRDLPLGEFGGPKSKALRTMTLAEGWEELPQGWRDPFRPPGTADWLSNPLLEQFFGYRGKGVLPGRGWVIAPDEQTLKDRWKELLTANPTERKAELFAEHTRNGKPGDRHIRKKATRRLGQRPQSAVPIMEETNANVPLAQYAMRSFDRQNIVADIRVLNVQNPQLWAWHSDKQVYLTAQEDRAPRAGPSITFTSLIPDAHHFGGRGGTVYPLWRDEEAEEPNVRPSLLEHLTEEYAFAVEPEDVLAYTAALLAHPGYLTRYRDELRRPGARVPLTSDGELFVEVRDVGREVIWLHTFGERFTGLGRPKGAPRLKDGPTLQKAPGTDANGDPLPGATLPDDYSYDEDKRKLHVGTGVFANVSPEIARYAVNGKRVLDVWFGYRRADREKSQDADDRQGSPLMETYTRSWTSALTRELFNLLHVIARLVALEGKQESLLARVQDGARFVAADLVDDGAIPEVGLD